MYRRTFAKLIGGLSLTPYFSKRKEKWTKFYVSRTSTSIGWIKGKKFVISLDSDKCAIVQCNNTMLFVPLLSNKELNIEKTKRKIENVTNFDKYVLIHIINGGYNGLAACALENQFFI